MLDKIIDFCWTSLFAGTCTYLNNGEIKDEYINKLITYYNTKYTFTCKKCKGNASPVFDTLCDYQCKNCGRIFSKTDSKHNISLEIFRYEYMSWSILPKTKRKIIDILKKRLNQN